MSLELLLVASVLLVPVVLLLGFAGCVGISPDTSGTPAPATPAPATSPPATPPPATLPAGPVAPPPPTTYDQIVLGTGDIVSYWRLDELETGGTESADLAPAPKNPGEYKGLQGMSRGEAGVLTLVKDPNDKAVEFHGTEGYVEVPYTHLLNPDFDFSVEAWLRPEASTDAQVVVSANEEIGSGLATGFVIEVVPPAAAGGPPLVRARVGGGSDFTSLEASLGDGSQNDGWRHVVLTYAGSNKSLKLYVNADDGKPDAERPSASAPGPVLYAPNQGTPLRIAAGIVVDPAGTRGLAHFFRGRIDEVALYRVPLSGTTVRNHFLAATTPS